MGPTSVLSIQETGPFFSKILDFIYMFQKNTDDRSIESCISDKVNLVFGRTRYDLPVFVPNPSIFSCLSHTKNAYDLVDPSRKTIF